MSNEPQIQERVAQHYAAIPVTVTMDGLSSAVDSAFSELFPWLASQGIVPAGPPLIRYLVIDMAGEMKVEMAVPVATPITASGRIQPGILPGGRYAVLRHTGPYDGLVDSNAALLRWAQENGVEFDTWDTPQGSAWRSRTEHYLTDPSQEPDPAKLETDVAFLLAQRTGDDRYDIALSNREEREQHEAGKASRDAAFRAALDAPPGTPPDRESF